MLVLARESRGLNQNELATMVGISQGEISKIESGLREPSADQIGRFARVLRYQEDFLYVTDAVRNFGSSCVYHRKRKTTSERVLRRILAMVNVCRIQVRRLLQSVEIDADNKFSPFDIEEHSGNVERIAQSVRAVWRMPPGPVQNLTREIEDAGGIIVRCDFGTPKVDAVSQWLPDLPPMFFVNMAIPTDRLRFTLAHEIGHVIMHQVPTEDMEHEADRFAAEFLMPAREIRHQLRDLSLPKLASLKAFWKVSMAALLKRAGDLNTIGPRSKALLWTQMGRAGYRSIEPVTIPTEEPSLLDEVITAHSKELGYSREEIGKLVYGLESPLAEVLRPQKYTLRVIS